MTTPEEGPARIGSILEQLNQRVGEIERRVGNLEGGQELINDRVGGVGERLARIEGYFEQMSQRQGNVERLLEQKAGKDELRLLFVATTTLLAAVLGALGAVLATI